MILIRDHIAITEPGFTYFNRRCDSTGEGIFGNSAAELRFATPRGNPEDY